MKTENSILTNKFSLTIIFGVVVVALSILSGGAANAATYTWDGGGVDTNWSTCANWSTDTCPLATDSVTFNATSTKDASINSGFQGTVVNLTINSGYTGTITMARTLAVSSTLQQNDGTFNAASFVPTLRNLTLTNGTFTASSATTNLSGNLSLSPGATFNHNSGVLNLVEASTIASTYACGNKTFNRVTINKNFDYYVTHTMGSDCTFPLGNNPTIRFARNIFVINGTLTGTGTLTVTRHLGGLGGDQTIRIGSTGQLVGFSGYVQDTGFLHIDNATVNFSTYTNTSLNHLAIENNGNFIAPTGTLTITASSNATINQQSGSTFNANNGTVVLGGKNKLIGDITFYNLTKANSPTGSEIEFAAGSTQTVLGTLNLSGRKPYAPLYLKSSTPGSTWNINPQGTRTLSNIHITDGTNTNASIIAITNGIDNGNNHNWNIIPTPPIIAYLANDLLGQVDVSGMPVWTTSDPNNGDVAPNNKGLNYPMGTAFDAVHHRLFVAECGSRVTVFNLDANNNFVDREADYVLGQPDFISSGGSTAQNRVNCPVGPSYDPDANRLFVPEYNNSRVLVFDLSSGITNGMNASYVLGQPDFTSNTGALTQSGINGAWGGSQYDTDRKLLFISDYDNNRVLVFDLSSGITNGMNASYVIGQPDFTSSAAALTQSGLSSPYGLALDMPGDRLFVADWGSASHRVLVYDVSTANLLAHPEGMNAVNVLGQPDFTTDGYTNVTQSSINCPANLVYDTSRQRLFAQDDCSNRVMVFDLSAGITNNMNATAVIGQAEFTDDDYSCVPARNSQCDAEGSSDAFDAVNNRLFLSDSSHNRVLVFDFITIATNTLPGGSKGLSYNQTLSSNHYQGDLTYSIISGALPAGITLTTDGNLQGTPTSTGTFSFAVQATDTVGAIGYFTDKKELTLTIVNDDDNDGISDAIEASSPLGNDVNNDSIDDNKQATVATSFNDITQNYISVVVNNCASGFSMFTNESESSLPQQDKDYTYIHGLQNFTVNCGVTGATATFDQYFDKVYDTSSWKYRKFMPNKGFIDITNQVSISTATVNGKSVTKVTYSVTDGGEFDADGVVNGSITDPLGAATPAVNGSLANTGIAQPQLIFYTTLLLLGVSGSVTVLGKKL